MDPDADPGGPKTYMDPTDPNPQHWYQLLPCRHPHPSHCWTRWGQWVQSSPWCRCSSCWQGWEGPTPCSQTKTFCGTHKSPGLSVLLRFSFQKSGRAWAQKLFPLLPFRQLLFLFVLSWVQAPCLLSLYHTWTTVVKVWCLIQVALYFSFCLPEMIQILSRLKRYRIETKDTGNVWYWAYWTVFRIRAGFNADPDADPDPAFLGQCGSGSRVLMTKYWKIIFKFFIDKKLQYSYPEASLGVQSTAEAFNQQKRTSSTSK
jgi:hypothetical protein